MLMPGVSPIEAEGLPLWWWAPRRGTQAAPRRPGGVSEAEAAVPRWMQTTSPTRRAQRAATGGAP